MNTTTVRTRCNIAMIEYYERRRLFRLLYSKGFLALIFVVVCLLGTAAWHAYTRERETAQALAAAQGALQSVTGREEELNDELATLDDTLGLETELRSKYEVGREGEHMIVLVEEATVVDPQVRTTPEHETSWWQKIFNRSR